MDRRLTKNDCFSTLKRYSAWPLLLLIFLMGKPAYSQIEDAGQILQAGTEDAKILLKEYLRPFGGGFGADLNTGWFTSARPLKKFGFDLRASVSASFVPVSHQSFDVSTLPLNSVQLLSGPSQTPTLFGDDEGVSTLGSTEYNPSTQQEEEIYSFNMPEGSGYHIVPAPMAQFTFGLPGHTQVTFRYSPEVVIDSDYSFRLFGIGGMVGLNQLFWDNQLPVDLSVQAGIMNLSAEAKFEVLPPEGNHIENRFPDSHWEGQALDFDTNTFTTNIIAGKQFSILSLFGGVGYQYASTSITTKGPYPIVVPLNENDSESPNTTHEIQSVSVPIDISLDGENTLHALGGFQLKVGFISLSASYTAAKYSTVRAGLGIMF